MVTRVQDLKGAFISCCPRENGLPLGRTALQDFEIAYFLNIAYCQCVKSRVDALAQGFHSISNDKTMSAARDHKLGNIITELGDLYMPQVQDLTLSPSGYEGESKWRFWGPRSNVFEIRKLNGYIPYIVGAQLHEVYEPSRTFFFGSEYKEDKATTAAAKKAKIDPKEYAYRKYLSKGETSNKSWPIRIVEGSEVLEYSLLFQATAKEIDRLPYRIGRLRAFNLESWAKFVSSIWKKFGNALQRLVERGGANAEQEAEKAIVDLITSNVSHQKFYCLEVLHTDAEVNHRIYANIETVMHPQPILESEVAGTNWNDSRTIECAFGYEIAKVAADIATASMSAGGRHIESGVNG